MDAHLFSAPDACVAGTTPPVDSGVRHLTGADVESPQLAADVTTLDAGFQLAGQMRQSRVETFQQWSDRIGRVIPVDSWESL